MAWPGTAGEARHGEARLGEARWVEEIHGTAGTVSRGDLWPVETWFGRHGMPERNDFK